MAHAGHRHDIRSGIRPPGQPAREHVPARGADAAGGARPHRAKWGGRSGTPLGAARRDVGAGWQRAVADGRHRVAEALAGTVVAGGGGRPADIHCPPTRGRMADGVACGRHDAVCRGRADRLHHLLPGLRVAAPAGGRQPQRALAQPAVAADGRRRVDARGAPVPPSAGRAVAPLHGGGVHTIYYM